MAVSSEYVAAIRQRLRLTTDNFDNEITDLINAAPRRPCARRRC